MLVSVQYHPHCHVAILGQGLYALRTRSQASGRKTVNPLRIMSTTSDDATIANAIANAATASTTATATGTADGHAANLSGSSMVAQPVTFHRLPRLARPQARRPGLMTLAPADVHGAIR